ncbi:MAG: hypothetical protein JNL19_09405 [Burkholderiales bacterium]|nr:hypothetical protein [Burkholderiales bacterium]
MLARRLLTLLRCWIHRVAPLLANALAATTLLSLATTVHAEKSTFSLFIGQWNAPLNTVSVKVMQGDAHVGTCNYATAQRGTYPLMKPSHVQSEMAWCNYALEIGQPHQLVVTGNLTTWYCPPGQPGFCLANQHFTPGHTPTHAVMVFKGGNPLVEYTLYLKTDPKLTGDNGAVVLMQFFRNMGQCGGAGGGGTMLNGYHVCKYQLEPGKQYAVDALKPMVAAKTVSCGGPAPMGKCYGAPSFTPDGEGFSVVTLAKKA